MRILFGILVGLFVCASVQAQAPFRRNYYTTNAVPASASQTPWAGDINGGGFAITNGYVGTPPGAIVPSKTYLVFMGDSLTAGFVPLRYPYLLTNTVATTEVFPAWTNLFFVTNQALAGTTMVLQTNVFWTSTFPSLPATASNGTNVIVSALFGANEVMNAEGTNLITTMSNFVASIQSRGYKFVAMTPLPRASWNRVAVSEAAYSKICDYITMSTNFNYIVDTAAILTNPFDPLWFGDTDPTNGVLAGLHPTAEGYKLMAKEWDNSVRLGSRPRQTSSISRQFGNVWRWVNRDGTTANRMSGVGELDQVKGGTLVSAAAIASTAAGVFQGKNLSDSSLAVFQVNGGNSDFFTVYTSNGAAAIKVLPSGSVTLSSPGGPVIAGNDMQITHGGAVAYLSLFYTSGHDYRIESGNFFTIRDITAASAQRFWIGPDGDAAFPTTTNLNVYGRTTSTNGFSGLRSNLLASTSMTFPATTVNWTNPLTVSILVYIDNATVTGTAVKKNGTQIFGTLPAGVTLGLQIGEYFSETYTVNTPTATWHPFP